MRKIYGLMFLLAFAATGFAQNVGINSSGSAPDASAGLDVSFTDKGLLIPRLALTATNSASPVTSPTTSLLVYNTATAGSAPNNVVPGYYYWNGSAWVSLVSGTATQWTTNGSNIYYNGGNVGIGNNTSPAYKLQVNASSNPLYLTGVQAGSNTDSLLTIINGVVKKLAPTALATPSTNAWSLSGNSSANTNFLGTTNNQSLRMRTNNTQRMYVDSLGSVSVGTSPSFATSREKFLVDAGVTTSYNVISGKGAINNYLQLNIQNRSSGTLASSDLVATADNGDETTNYVDLGINSSGNTAGYFGGANDAYLYNLGQNFLIGTGTAAKSLVFLTGGGTQSTNERMRIDGNGLVGIGANNPSYKLSVVGTNPLYLGGLQTGTSTDSVLTLSGGVVKRVLPTSFSQWTTSGSNIYRSTGNVGIGTSTFDATTPEKLLVDGGSGGSSAMNLIIGKGNTNNYMQSGVQNLSHGNNASSDFVVTADGSRNGAVADGTDNFYLDFGINSSGYSTNNSNILNQTNTPYLYASAPQDFFIGQGYPNKDIVFFTNYGNLNGNNSADGTEIMRLKGGTSSSTQQVTIGTATPNGTNKLTVSGTISASAFNTSSDRRLKTNILPLNYGLKAVQLLNPVSYNWIDPKQSSQKQIGLIAQDTKKVIPEVVSGNESKGMLSINYTELVPVLINAIKEQQKQIDELRGMVVKLQNASASKLGTTASNK